MKNSSPIIIAYQPKSKRYIHIDEASNGLSCGCVCLQCNERLEAVQGTIRIKHFRHHVNINCMGAQETALHELGKQILVENNQINIRNHGTITYTNGVAEQKLEKYRPDVTALYEDKPIYFEIFVSHAVDSGKSKFYTDKKFKSVEINLSSCRESSYEEIKHMVLEQTELQTVFFWHEEAVVETPVVNQDEIKWFEQVLRVVFFLLLALGIVRLLTNKRKN